MQIREIMSAPVVTCRSTEMLNVAAQQMWEHDLGIVLVTSDDGRLVGVITDRDICMATYTKGLAPQSIGIGDVMSRDLKVAHESDPVEAAEHAMATHRVRRLPIVDDDFRPVGVLSLNDLARTAAQSRGKGTQQREVLETLASICEPRFQAPAPHVTTPRPRPV